MCISQGSLREAESLGNIQQQTCCEGSIFLSCGSWLNHLQDAVASVSRRPGRQSPIEDACEVREAQTNWSCRYELEPQRQTNQSVPHHLQDSNDRGLQKKLLFFVMALNTHLAQEKYSPQELGPDIEGVIEKSAYQYKSCSFVVM